ncbi:MAG: cupin domain-containing protein [Promethearchaeota archaeon]
MSDKENPEILDLETLLDYIIDGKAEIIISKKPYILEKGQMITMPANDPHALNALERFKMMLIMVKA